MTETISPSELLASIQRHKSKEDPHGDSAFELGYNSPKTAKNNVRYFSFKIAKMKSYGKEEFIPLNLKFMNIKTKSTPKPWAEREYKNTNLQFRVSSSYSKKVMKNGKLTEIEEPYGKARLAICQAFVRILTKLLKSKKINANVTTIKTNVQTEVIKNKAKHTTEKLEDGVIRVRIAYEGESQDNNQPGQIPVCKIYDAEARKTSEEICEEARKHNINPSAVWPFKYAVDTGNLVDADNIGKFIRSGSSVSGVDCMDSACSSSQGFSLPSKATLLIVKKSKGYKPIPTEIFDANDIESFADALTVDYEEEELLSGNQAKEFDLDNALDNTSVVDNELDTDNELDNMLSDDSDLGDDL